MNLPATIDPQSFSSSALAWLLVLPAIATGFATAFGFMLPTLVRLKADVATLIGKHDDNKKNIERNQDDIKKILLLTPSSAPTTVVVSEQHPDARPQQL